MPVPHVEPAVPRPGTIQIRGETAQHNRQNPVLLATFLLCHTETVDRKTLAIRPGGRRPCTASPMYIVVTHPGSHRRSQLLQSFWRQVPQLRVP
jgi:hypothetical protein